MKFFSAVIVIVTFLFASCKEKTLFTLLPSSYTEIHFNNSIIESEAMNPLNHVNIYNGGGVGAGDFNGDGLQDIYFTGNMVSNQLYLNKGNLRFEDITKSSGTDGAGRWCRGVSVVDINSDGKQDIYVSVSMDDHAVKRRNLLYVNMGNQKNGIPVFKEMAAEYGLDDTSHTTMTLFFDYDNDNDLDAYLVVNEHIAADNPNRFRPLRTDGSHPSTGRLYRNDWNDTLKHAVFTDVSYAAGTIIEGYGHAGIITDINLDGWKDIYITNDFLSNNILYVNNRNGTFTDRSKEYFKQTSTFAMGVDVQDLNNDGLLDIVELDMNPQDNYRKKMMLGSNSYQTMQNFDRYGYQYQYSRNTLQVNQGNMVKENDSVGHPVFSQISFLSGMSQTDWSWTPLVTDFDDDGYRDIIITNGYPKDVTDHDFITYRSKASLIASSSDILTQIPQVKLHNYAYLNKGDLQFNDVTEKWGLTIKSFSNGAAYADLDNDGDMDIIVNNINDKAFVYRNESTHSGNSTKHFLNVTLSGSGGNPGGYGSWIYIYYGKGVRQVYEHSPYRGYLSSVQGMVHFGLGNHTLIDSLVVIWPDFSKQVIQNVHADQLLQINTGNAGLKYDYKQPATAAEALFTEVTSKLGIQYTHHENDFVDFNIQKLLPHKFSAYSPALSVADVDGNGLEDLLCGGNSLSPAVIFYQQEDGKFTEKKLLTALPVDSKTPPDYYNAGSGVAYKDEGILLFDADGDGDEDMYIARGGYEQQPGSSTYQDMFYVNDGKGNFTPDSMALPKNYTSKLCVRAADFDKDGDLDLFVAGRVDPWNYPKPVSGFLFRNDSKKNSIRFIDVTSSIAKSLMNTGMVCDAVFSDFDNDGWQDLLLAGEWMPLTFLKNNSGLFEDVTGKSGISNYSGWWNTIAPGDFDNDGDMDYIAGNVGLNTFFKATEQYPVYITAKDFNDDGSYDAFPSVFLPVSHENKELKEFPVNQRDDMAKQMISMRMKYQNYKTFANATMDSVFSPEQMKGALRLKANTLASMFVKNMGNGKFTLAPLPMQAQVSVLNGIVVDDFNADGNLDLLINGNDYGTDVSVGRYDALNGLVMKGDGKGNFMPLSILQSGVYIPGNGKALVQLSNREGQTLIAASQHNGPLKMFKLKSHPRFVKIQPLDKSALIRYKDGRVQQREFYYGYSFLSQSARCLNLTEQVESVSITDNKGVIRKL